jgi:hypothetical protein
MAFGEVVVTANDISARNDRLAFVVGWSKTRLRETIPGRIVIQRQMSIKSKRCFVQPYIWQPILLVDCYERHGEDSTSG